MENNMVTSNNITDTSSFFTPQHILPIFLGIIFILVLLRTAISELSANKSKLDKNLQGPPSLPFIGILKFALDNWEKWPSTVAECSKKYGKTWGGPLPNLGVLGGGTHYITDQKCVEYILKDNFLNYEKTHHFREFLVELLGYGVFTTDGDLWKLHRKTASHFFSRNLLREATNITNNKMAEIVDWMNSRLTNPSHLYEISDGEHTKTIQGGMIDIQDIFYRMTIDVIVEMAFGIKLNSIKQGNQHEFAIAFDAVQDACSKRIPDPLFKVKKFLRIGKREKVIHEQMKIINKFGEQVINSKRRTLESGGKLGSDLLSRYIDLSRSFNDKVENKTSTNQQLQDTIMNFVLAGRDTTAGALSFAMYELSRHPEVVEKVVEELQSICSNSDNKMDFSYDNMNRLSYTHAVVMEVLRLHPSVPVDHKYAINDDVLPDGTFIPQGTMINYSPYFMGRDEEIWGPDVLQFRPERFLVDNGNGDIKLKEISPYLLPVFNAGPRMCIGKPLALMEMKLALSYLLTNFSFFDKNGHSGEYKWTLTMKLKGGLPLFYTRR